MPPSILSILSTGFDLFLVVLGFGLIIFFHELGHFLAARWAGIRVLTFAVGFGPPLVSYRRGLGFRRGSSAGEVQKIAEARGLAKPGRPALVPGISPTEYSLNVLPFGGYVKMLGQEDGNPEARSDEPDGYQSTPVWKRMVVISAGVVANFILAAVIFVFVFMVGLKTEPATVGMVTPSSPAAKTVAINAKKLGVTEPGLQPGDRIRTINNARPDDFTEVIVSVAMARKGRYVRMEVEREGLDEPLLFDIMPEVNPATNLMNIGIQPAMSPTLIDPKDEATREQLRKALTREGLPGVEPGMRLVRVGDQATVKGPHLIEEAAQQSGGRAIELTFRAPAAADGNGKEVTVTVRPTRELEDSKFYILSRPTMASHLLGLMPVLSAGEIVKGSPAEAGGLKNGDVFAQIGSVEWPGIAEGIAEIRSNANGAVRVVVVREQDGVATEVDLGDVAVRRDGTMGFGAAVRTNAEARVTAWPAKLVTPPDDTNGASPPPSGATLSLMRGSTILGVNDAPVGSFDGLASTLVDATAAAYAVGDAATTVKLAVELPVRQDGKPVIEHVEWTLSRADIEKLQAMPWTVNLGALPFAYEEVLLQASDPINAMVMGVNRTHRVMMQTYLTFSRLFQGTVKVEHLKGPVGIAHTGTMVASRGLVHLLFFFALISVNLGVVNFLPLPVVDGGHFLFLLYEQIMGKPVSVAFQNFATFAGLILIVGMFLLVTYNDLFTLFS